MEIVFNIFSYIFSYIKNYIIYILEKMVFCLNKLKQKRKIRILIILLNKRLAKETRVASKICNFKTLLFTMTAIMVITILFFAKTTAVAWFGPKSFAIEQKGEILTWLTVFLTEFFALILSFKGGKKNRELQFTGIIGTILTFLYFLAILVRGHIL